MGVVYRARDPRLHRVVAIKRIHPNLQGSAPAAERFIREARAIAAVSHPNIAQIFSIHDSDGEEQGFFVMEFVAGPSVEARASAEGGLEVAEAISIIAQASRGLAAALKRGIIHRDMKPSNLLLTPQGDVKIVDFGLASQAANVEVDEEEILCTPQFGSPEQVRGWAIDHRSDIYSLGATLFYLLIGREPFPRENRVEVFVAHANEPPPRPGSLRQGIPERLDQVVLKMLAKRPQDRYEDYEALLTDLEEIHRELTGTSTKLSRGRRLLPTISVGLLLLFVAAGLGRELLGKGSTSVIPIEQRLRGIISQAPPYERLSYTFSDRNRADWSATSAFPDSPRRRAPTQASPRRFAGACCSGRMIRDRSPSLSSRIFGNSTFADCASSVALTSNCFSATTRTTLAISCAYDSASEHPT